MTFEEREQIFSKDVINYKELAKLLDMDESTASTFLHKMKYKSDRLGIRGRIHIQDYFDYFGITNFDRYKIDKPIGDLSNIT